MLSLSRCKKLPLWMCPSSQKVCQLLSLLTAMPIVQLYCCLEIARLQNSLQHLRRTQHELQIATDTDYDPEIAKALEENNEVMSVLCNVCARLD